MPFVRLSGPSSRAPRAIYITRHSSEWSSVRRGRLVLIIANLLQKRLSPFCVISISLSTCSCLSYVSPGLVSPSPISVLTFTFRIRRRFLLTPWRRYQHFSQFPGPCFYLPLPLPDAIDIADWPVNPSNDCYLDDIKNSHIVRRSPVYDISRGKIIHPLEYKERLTGAIVLVCLSSFLSIFYLCKASFPMTYFYVEMY